MHRGKEPLPTDDHGLRTPTTGNYFHKLDFWNTYHLVRIREGDKWKTAFKTLNGHYEYQAVPFGLVSAPAVFQALISDVLCDMLNKFVFVFFVF